MCNKYGLTRASFKEDKKAIIRKRDGFGCVKCGLGFYTYEHYNPEFKDAKEHNINGICLLCGQCQLKASKSVLSKTTIASWAKNPKCNQRGYTNEFFDLEFPIIVHLGNIIIRTEGDKDHNILVLGNEAVLKVNACAKEEPFRFSAIFKDQQDNISLKIDKNEWIAPVHSWDIEQVGKRLSIINNPLDTKIVILANPPHELIFEELDTYYNGGKVHFDNKGIFIIKNSSGQTINNINVDSPQRIRSLTIT